MLSISGLYWKVFYPLVIQLSCSSPPALCGIFPNDVPQGGTGEEARSGQGARSAARARRRGGEGEQTRVQQFDQLHVLLQQHVLVQNAFHRVLTEHAVLRGRKGGKHYPSFLFKGQTLCQPPVLLTSCCSSLRDAAAWWTGLHLHKASASLQNLPPCRSGFHDFTLSPRGEADSRFKY